MVRLAFVRGWRFARAASGLVALAFASLDASACSFVRLDDVSGPLARSPVLDQRGLDLCEFYAAAKLIDAATHYAEPRQFKPASPLPVAAQWLMANGDTNVVTYTVLEWLLKEGRSTCAIRAGEAEGAEFASGRLPGWAAAVCEPGNTLTLKHLSAPQRLSGFTLLSEDARIAAFMQQINASLDSPKPVPVAFRYCFRVLVDADFIGINRETGKSGRDLCTLSAGNTGLHSSVIIGRRQGPRGCQYLVMNSHGASCSGYDKRWSCEGGKVWIDAAELLRNTTGLTWLPTIDLPTPAVPKQGRSQG